MTNAAIRWYFIISNKFHKINQESRRELKDLNAISQKTGISVASLKKALSIPMEPCPAKTVDEAKKIYDLAQSGSEEEKTAFAKWNELSMGEVDAAKTVCEIRKAYQDSPDDSEARKAAHAKWDVLSLKEVDTAKTVDEVMVALQNAPHSDSKAKKEAIIKIYELF